MNVKHHLPRIRIHIENSPIARLVNTPVCGNARSRVHHMADNLIVLGRQVVERGDVEFRHYQDMCRRLRIDVFEGVNAIVFVYFRRGNLPCDDPAEQAIGHAPYFNLFMVLGKR